MIVERGTRSSEPVARPENGADRSAAASQEQLEHRVRRLEEAVAGLQDTRPMEERIVERVTEKVARATSRESNESSSFIMEAGRHLLPGALALASIPRASSEREPAVSARPTRRGWWFFEAYDDLRTMIRMFSDRRYRPHMTWTAFLTPFFLVVCILAVWLLMPTGLPLVGPLLRVFDKLVDLVLAFFAYKILLREVRRYREMLPG